MSRALPIAAFLGVAADAALLHFRPLGTEGLYLARLGGAAGILVFLTAIGVPRRSLGLAFEHARSDGAWLLRVSALLFGLALLLLGIWYGTAALGWWRLPLSLGRDFDSWSGARRFAVVALLLAPVMEETLYRGLVVSALRESLPEWGVIVVSGVMFYCLHLAYGNDWRLFHYLPAGMILGWAFLRRGRLWIPIALHLLGNLLMGADDALRLLIN